MENTAIDFLRQHLPELALAAATQIKAANIKLYQELEVSQMAEILIPTIEMDISYLENENLSEWREFHQKLYGRVIKNGYGYGSLVQIGLRITHTLKEFLDTQMLALGTIEGKPATQVVNALQRRLATLTAAAISFTAETGLKDNLE